MYMGGIKEEFEKFLVIHYQNGKLCLREPASVSTTAIHMITRIPYKGDKLPQIVNINKWIHEFTRGLTIKNSLVKWDCIIITLYLTPIGRASNVKLTMLESIGEIMKSGKTYNWAEHVTNLVKTNW